MGGAGISGTGCFGTGVSGASGLIGVTGVAGVAGVTGMNMRDYSKWIREQKEEDIKHRVKFLRWTKITFAITLLIQIFLIGNEYYIFLINKKIEFGFWFYLSHLIWFLWTLWVSKKYLKSIREEEDKITISILEL